MSFHINPSTGVPGRCKAEKTCPFGGPDVHFTTADQARSAFEDSQKAFVEDPFAKYSTDELAKIETDMLVNFRLTGQELTDEEYNRHYEYIRRIRKNSPSTHKQFTTTVKGKAVYTDARLEQHEKIVAMFSHAYEAIANDGEVLIVGGITGSGKTTAIAGHPELLAEKYALVNPDEIKVAMIQSEMAPVIPGLLPLETDELIKYEAQLITEKVYNHLSLQKKNLVIDRTMTSENQITKTVEDLKAKGYSTFTGVFVDIDPDEAYERIRNRHHAGINQYLKTGQGFGERPVPGSAIAATRTDDPNYRSKNAKVFVGLVDSGIFTSSPTIFDSSDGSKEIPFHVFKK